MSRIPQINIGLFGFGTVGSRVYEILDKHSSLIEKKLGYPIKVKKICDSDPKKKFPVHVPSHLLTNKPHEVLDDPEISIIVELIGDKPAALEVMSKAIKLGKHVVTANKAILAVHGAELFAEAAKNDVDLFFEAAVAGAIPVLRAIREGFIADRILGIQGIINGTSNFILTAMSRDRKEFGEVLAEAQKLGYAEADPKSDVEGIDSAHKLALLTGLAYGQWIPVDKIYTEGITGITPLDIDMADRFGYTIKLLAISKKEGDDIEARVHPTMIPKNKMLAQVSGAFNAVMLHGEYFGESLLYGLGAGGHPTATAVISDIIEVARNISLRIPGVPPLGYRIETVQKGKIKPMEDIESEYYLRFTAQDKPGVFSKIANLLGQNQVSISSVYQHGREEGKEVPIVVITHRGREKNILSAVKEIDKLPLVSKKTLLVRIES